MRSLNTQLVILPLIFLFCTIKLVKTLSRGDQCVDLRNLKGTCKFIWECPSVMQFKINSRQYLRCDFEDGREVVCCGQRTPSRPAPTANPDIKYVQECEKYKSKMFDIEIPYTTLSADATQSKKIVSNCSQHTFPLVVGGEDALVKEFPHMALLGCEGNKGDTKWICGGTLISKNYILTAAHCITAIECDEITDVRLGELNVKSTNDGSQHRDYKVESRIKHPDYKETTKYNDIALIKLTEDVQFNEFIRPACLPYRDYTDTYQLLVTGWGSTENAGPKSDILQKAPVEPFTQEECNKAWTEDEEDEKLPIGVRERVQICAGSKDSNKDTCQGDSGGPLQIVHPNYPCMYSVIGVTSTGQACGVAGVPGIYTRTFYYTDWIQKIVWD